ncbi:hypothetical protein [Zavarzinella formosa]|uniref:hypothetical protein n=1 Tax=Zavarzinella formosa TaxID=360055 RepID=UPI0002EE2CA7|nr:hypothetical protein [Zavarzinella formosa]
MTSQEILDQSIETAHPPRQRSARTDASMRDGDSGRGNPSEDDVSDFLTDADTGDATGDDTNRPPEELEEGPGPSESRPHAEDAVGQPPFNGYDGLTVAALRKMLVSMPEDSIRQAAEYERKHRARKTLLSYMNQRLNNA